jgi:hypothetical protein
MENPTHEFGDYQTHLMEPEVEATCKAVMSQGKNKGKQCWRPPGDSGYCGKHKTAFAIETAKAIGLHKCSTHRCTTMLADGVKYCVDCVHNKDESMGSKTLCRGKITQGSNKGSPCDKEASTLEGFCGKHTLNVLVEKAAEDGRRICDDGKRACKNYTSDGKSKCEDCLEVIRTKQRTDHAVLRESGNCLGCGKDLAAPIEGFRREDVQRCQECYEKLKEIEKRRVREPRNYRKECKDNLDRYYGEYNANARKRGLLFDLSFDVFCELVSSPCEYCDAHVANEVNGIDRVDNMVGYIYENSVPCCGVCNKMKSDYTIDEFKAHIVRIYEKLAKTHSIAHPPTISVPEIKNSSYKRPKEILAYYSKGNLDEYIVICEKDGRSPNMIRKLTEMSTMDLNEHKARNHIKNILKSETKSGELQRKNICKKEMYGYLKHGNVDACVDHYSRVHGTPDGFQAEMEALASDLNETEFTRILVKYQNLRNS